jgi:hypothetical protein
MQLADDAKPGCASENGSGINAAPHHAKRRRIRGFISAPENPEKNEKG